MAELEKKYTGQLTKKFMENLADRLAVKVKEEKDIEGAIAELENSPIRVTDLQSEGDRRATELQTKFQQTKAEIEADKNKIKEELERLKEKPPGSDNKGDDDKIKKLEERLATFEQRETEREIKSQLVEKAKEKKIPPALYKNLKIESVDEIDQVVNDLEKEAQEIKQAWINEGVVQKSPSKGDGGASGNEQIEDDIKTFSKGIR